MPHFQQHYAMRRNFCSERCFEKTKIFLLPQVSCPIIAFKARTFPINGNDLVGFAQVKNANCVTTIFQLFNPHPVIDFFNFLLCLFTQQVLRQKRKCSNCFFIMPPLSVIKLHGISYLHFSIEENRRGLIYESEGLNGTGM
jgi:hypothetical protein